MDSSGKLFNQLKTAEPFFLLAGPNVIESEEHVLRMAGHIKDIASKLGLQLVFKSSFDKANRTSSKSFRGPGLAEGLKILEKVKVAYDIPIVTDVHEANQVLPLADLLLIDEVEVWQIYMRHWSKFAPRLISVPTSSSVHRPDFNRDDSFSHKEMNERE